MARQRSPNRDKAKQMWLESKGKLKLKDIAATLGILDTQVRKWKSLDKWGQELKGTLPKRKRNVTKKKRRPGAPPNNKNAVGHGAPEGNKNGEKHGFFAKIFPEDTLDIIEEIQIKSPLDILWENIVIQYTAIARAQRIMYVQGKYEMIKELKKEKVEKTLEGPEDNKEAIETYREEEYEFQFAWDRQATLLNAQARAVKTLLSTIEKYQEMLPKTLEYEEQRLKVEKLKAEVNKLNKDGDEEGAISLKKAIEEAWAERINKNVHG